MTVWRRTVSRGPCLPSLKVTSISGFDRLLEYRVALELEVTPSARAYIGYRMLEVEFDSAGRSVDYEVDDSANIGVRFEF